MVKNTKKPIFILLLAVCLAAPTFLFAADMDISVKIKEIKNKKGQMLIALHNKPKSFPSDHKLAVQKIKIPLENKQSDLKNGDTVIYTFKNIPPGTYAISCIHDENNNDEMDHLLFFPAEGYGTSNDIRGQFGPPSFHDAKFTVASQNVSIDIKMGY